MSTFLGLIKEIPGISVDRFDGENLTSSVFFLSHCHCDHMHGLSDHFFEYLDENNKYLYCSHITKALLKNKFKFKDNCVKEVTIDTSIVIEYKVQNEDEILISVTSISAGHCPGSVMFLFERNNVSVLYTGDFRINPKDFSKLKSLHYCKDSKLFPRTFTKIYLDTTFLSNDFAFFPTRQETVLKICTVTKDWLNKDPRNVVILECSATYGSEFLFIELFKVLNMKIHVKHYVYETYCRIEQLSCCVTNDPNSTPIHACKQKISSSGLRCRSNVKEENIMIIIPSVMKWRKKDTSVIGEWDTVRERTFNVCYATHSSFNELKAFIQYFKALEIYPCVVKTEEEQEVYHLLDEIANKSDKQIILKQTYKLKLPNKKESNKVPFKSEYFSSDDDSL
ncbi:protein artemis isoform X2 [Osmia bicornis bicornis]|uniref:protein artemis isoform X2 n=1 Tax=Osmia bicornis bicornis TaxID=1437191 RepID=UPI0010FA585E|nr:protein artemis isoform X2 [Osmia bicornis bicornis]XP_046142567.1 protein artemis isoform X2 [Osmia bicornis bicornis]